ncbi:MAG TPA: hypothetical protein ACQGQX_08825, partial [Xylella taiwanensis]
MLQIHCLNHVGVCTKQNMQQSGASAHTGRHFHTEIPRLHFYPLVYLKITLAAGIILLTEHNDQCDI